MGISRIAVFKRVKKGQLTAIRVGRNWAVPVEAIDLSTDTPNRRQKLTGQPRPAPVTAPAAMLPASPPAREQAPDKAAPPPAFGQPAPVAMRQEEQPPAAQNKGNGKDSLDDMGWD
jgi:hypothetical protein